MASGHKKRLKHLRLLGKEETPETARGAGRETAKGTPETVVGEDRRDSETAEVDQCWSVVASMGQWCSAVGARASSHKKRLKCLRLLGK